MSRMDNKSNLELLSTILGGAFNAHTLSGFSARSIFCAEDTEQLYQYGFTQEESERLLASITLAKNMYGETTDTPVHICNSGSVARSFMPLLRYKAHEEAWVVALSAKNNVIARKKISQGTLISTLMPPREIFEFACLSHAYSIIVIHNHPSGSSSPSGQDDKATKSIIKAGKAMGIPLLDHIIIGDGEYYSYMEDGKL